MFGQVRQDDDLRDATKSGGHETGVDKQDDYFDGTLDHHLLQHAFAFCTSGPGDPGPQETTPSRRAVQTVPSLVVSPSRSI